MADSSVQREVMVDTQVRPSDVTKFPIIDALLTVARENFVPENARLTAYADGPVPLAPGRAVLEPRSFAKMLDALDIAPDELVLDLGAGLGYSAAVLARMAEAVVAVEEDEAMAKDAETLLAEAEADNVAVIQASISEGAAQHGPYDVVILEGAAEMIPQAILDQLKDGGRIAAIFMDGALGVCRIGLKSGNSVSWRDAFNAAADILPGFEREKAFQL